MVPDCNPLNARLRQYQGITVHQGIDDFQYLPLSINLIQRCYVEVKYSAVQRVTGETTFLGEIEL